MAENPDDHKTALELGWCYLQNDRSDDALAICERIDPDYEDSYDYHNLYAKTCYGRQDFEGALEHLEVIEKILRKMQPDGTKETEKRLSRLPEVLQIQGSCLYALGRRDEMMEKYEQAVPMAPDDPEILTQMAHLLLNQKNYERAAEVSRKVTELMPDSYHGYFLLSDALHELRRDRDAFHAVNRALELDGGDLAVYVLKMRILLRNGVWDGVRETLDFLHENGITDVLSVLWCEAQLAEFADQNTEKALEMYRKIAERLEKGEELPWASQLYFRMTVLMADKLRKPEDRPELLAMLEKGLGYDPDDEECLDYKAWLLARENRVEEALAIYHKLETIPNHPLNVERELAQLYYKDLGKNAEKALHYYQMLLDHEENDVLHFYAGTCRRYLKDFAGAEKNFLREREMVPDDIDSYRGLAYVYEAMGRYEDALENAEMVIKLRRNVEGDQSKYYFRKIQILRRLGRYQEAIQTVDEVTSIYGYESADKMKFDIYCQFGQWEKARQHLKEWKRSNRKRDLQHGAEVKLDLLLGEYKKARAALAKGAKKFNPSDYQYLQLTMAELDGDHAAQFRNWKEREDDSDYALMNMAQGCWWSGNYEEARNYAQRAVEKEEEMLKRHIVNETLYRSRRALMLAILGREEEAKAELAKVRRLPLCEDCNYCRCKDADIYEANIEEICGRYDSAMRLYLAGMEKWPDDLDFADGVRIIKRRKGIL